MSGCTWLIVLSCWVGCLTVEPSSAPAPEVIFWAIAMTKKTMT